MNRIQLDIQGSEYTFPINPVQYDPLDDLDIKSSRTVDGRLVRYAGNFDSRQRSMRWEGLPNTSQFNEMLATLRASVGLSGVRLNHKGLSRFANTDYWEDVRIDDVYYFYNKESSFQATSKLKYDIEMKFTYLRKQESEVLFALFTYDPNDYTNDIWINNVSGMRNMDAIICHSNLGILNTTALRGAFPTAKLLTYHNVQDQHMSSLTGIFWNELNAATYAFSGYMMKFIAGGSTPAGIVGHQILNLQGGLATQIEAVMSKPLADRLIYVISGNCMGAYNGFEYDGVYTDMFTGAYPTGKSIHFHNWINISGYTIDCDNDGVAETTDSIAIKYAIGKNYFMSGLRLALPNKILIANVGSQTESNHPSLNGITIENVGEGSADYALTHQRFNRQNAISSYYPKVNIAWAISATSSGKAALFTNSRNDVYYGFNDDFWGL